MFCTCALRARAHIEEVGESSVKDASECLIDAPMPMRYPQQLEVAMVSSPIEQVGDRRSRCRW